MNGWGELIATQAQQQLEKEKRLRDYEHRQAMTPYEHPHPDVRDVVEAVERWLHLNKKPKTQHR